MSSVIRRYLSWELMQYWLVFTLVLWLVLVTARFSLYLGQAASGHLPAGTVLHLLALKSVGFFIFLLPLTLFLALLWLLGRLNRDHETLALGASGVGLWHMYRAISVPVLVATVVVATLSFYLVPKSAKSGYQLRADAEQQLQAETLSAGRFHSLRGGRWLFYAQRQGALENELDEVFVHVQQSGRSQVLLAKRALLRQPEASDERFLVLLDGHRYDGTPGGADYRVLKFSEYAIRLQRRQSVATHKWDAVPTRALWSDRRPRAQAELQRRLSRPVSVVLLALVAVPLARFRPATGRFYPLWLGVLFFTLYFNLLATAGLWLAQGKVPAWLGLWWVHVLLIAVLLIWWQWLQPLRRRLRA